MSRTHSVNCPSPAAQRLNTHNRNATTGSLGTRMKLSTPSKIKLPVTAFRLCVVNRWTAGLGQFTETVKVIGPDQATVLRKSEIKFTLQDAVLSATNVTMLPQVEFKTAGAYYVEVLVDDVMKLRYPLPVIHTPQPEPGAPGAQQPKPPQTG